MNREIKFRGKMIPENEWIYGTLLRIPHPPVCMGKEESDKYYIQFADPRYMPDWNMPYKMVQGEVKTETIGQYTGLKDKNGKEIYEGDIVIDREDEVIGDIVWNKEEASFYFSILYENGTYEEEKLNDWVDVLEVIGNITDNPELLKD